MRSGLCAAHSSSSTPNYVFKELCAQGHGHARIEKGLPQTVPASLDKMSLHALVLNVTLYWKCHNKNLLVLCLLCPPVAFVVVPAVHPCPLLESHLAHCIPGPFPAFWHKCTYPIYLFRWVVAITYPCCCLPRCDPDIFYLCLGLHVSHWSCYPVPEAFLVQILVLLSPI